jgi:hypothetical protein
VALTGRPDCALVVFRWQKGKAEYCVSLAAAGDTATTPTTFDLFRSLALNPLDAETCCVLGPGGLRFYRLAEDQALLMRGATDQLMHRPPNNNHSGLSLDRRGSSGSSSSATVGSGGPSGGGALSASGCVEVTCAAWLKAPADTVVVGASDGGLALYTMGVFQSFLGACLPLGVAATSVLALACGVVVGGSDGGLRFLKLALLGLGEPFAVRKRDCNPQATSSHSHAPREWMCMCVCNKKNLARAR